GFEIGDCSITRNTAQYLQTAHDSRDGLSADIFPVLCGCIAGARKTPIHHAPDHGAGHVHNQPLQQPFSLVRRSCPYVVFEKPLALVANGSLRSCRQYDSSLTLCIVRNLAAAAALLVFAGSI